jgi:hypothetical protein
MCGSVMLGMRSSGDGADVARRDSAVEYAVEVLAAVAVNACSDGIVFEALSGVVTAAVVVLVVLHAMGGVGRRDNGEIDEALEVDELLLLGVVTVEHDRGVGVLGDGTLELVLESLD